MSKSERTLSIVETPFAAAKDLSIVQEDVLQEVSAADKEIANNVSEGFDDDNDDVSINASKNESTTSKIPLLKP